MSTLNNTLEKISILNKIDQDLRKAGYEDLSMREKKILDTLLDLMFEHFGKPDSVDIKQSGIA